MDLKQRKLNKSEWDSIEISVSKAEIDILNMIIKGFSDVNVKINNNNSLFTFLKIDYSEKIEDYLFNKYMRTSSDRIEKDIKICDPEYKNIGNNIVACKYTDKNFVHCPNLSWFQIITEKELNG